jgi:hypothetical protein
MPADGVRCLAKKNMFTNRVVLLRDGFVEIGGCCTLRIIERLSLALVYNGRSDYTPSSMTGESHM